MPKEEKKSSTKKKQEQPLPSLFNRMSKAIGDAVDYAVTGHEEKKK